VRIENPADFSMELQNSFGPTVVPQVASQMPKYLHLFVISSTQPQHCSVGYAAGNTLPYNLELPCPSFSNFAIGIPANRLCWSSQFCYNNTAKGERRTGPATTCLLSP